MTSNTRKNTLSAITVMSTVFLLGLIAFGAFDPSNFIPKSNPAVPSAAPVMTAEEVMKSAANSSFRKELTNAAFDTMMSEESHAGFREGEKVDFEAFKKEHILPWASFGGVTSNWLYMDEGSTELATPEGRKKRYNFWAGYAAAIEKHKAPEGVNITAHPCRADLCPILVEWPEPNMAE